MDFQVVLSSCYEKGIAPFILYSKMRDCSKRDVNTSEKCLELYKMYKQEDIFSKVLRCKRDELNSLLSQYATPQRECIYELVKMLHPSWRIAQNTAPVSINRGVAVKRQGETITASPPKRQATPTPAPPKQKPKPKGRNSAGQNPPQKQPHPPINPSKVVQVSVKKTGFGNPSVNITSISGSLEIIVSDVENEFKVFKNDNGRKIRYTKCVSKRKGGASIDLSDIDADKIQIVIPRGDYNELSLRKASGDVVIEDKQDCFYKLNVSSISGKLDITSSARKINISSSSSEMVLRYKAMQEKSDLRLSNQLGNIIVRFFDVSTISKKITAIYGKVYDKCGYSTLGHQAKLRVSSTYGNVYIL